ncbi:MAG: hypothetical protein Q4E33_03220 [Erysipelotrichaceae bacterium]|nr:hypothetical protein [Erysipelotrichaceae bacterium]
MSREHIISDEELKEINGGMLPNVSPEEVLSESVSHPQAFGGSAYIAKAFRSEEQEDIAALKEGRFNYALKEEKRVRSVLRVSSTRLNQLFKNRVK